MSHVHILKALLLKTTRTQFTEHGAGANLELLSPFGLGLLVLEGTLHTNKGER